MDLLVQVKHFWQERLRQAVGLGVDRYVRAYQTSFPTFGLISVISYSLLHA